MEIKSHIGEALALDPRVDMSRGPSHAFGMGLSFQTGVGKRKQASEIRPALLVDPKDREAVLELLRFRHRFRNLYGEDLDPAKTEAVQRVASAFFERSRSVHDEFVRKVSAIAESL